MGLVFGHGLVREMSPSIRIAVRTGGKFVAMPRPIPFLGGPYSYASVLCCFCTVRD